MSTVNPLILQRINDALNFKEADRVPIWEMLQHPGAFAHFAPGVPFPECAVIACTCLGIDATYGFYNVPADDAPPRGSLVAAAQTLWQTAPVFPTLDALVHWQPPALDEARLEEQLLAHYANMQQLCGTELLYLPQNGGFEFLPGYDTDTIMVFSEALSADMPALERFWDYQAEVARARNAVTARHHAAPVVQCCIDVAYNTGLMVSPALLHEHFFPRFRRVIEPLKHAGIKVIWHSDGDISSVLHEAIAIGIDGINPIDSGAPGMDIAAIKQAYGQKLILVGNVGCNHVLRFGTPEEVRADVRRCISAASVGGGHLLQCGDGQIMPDCPLENVIAYMDEAHRFGRYARG